MKPSPSSIRALALGVALALSFVGAPAQAQPRPAASPGEAAQAPVHEARSLIDQIRRSTLEPGWRAVAEARAARLAARLGQPEPARVHAQNAELALTEAARVTPVVASATVLALLAQALAEAGHSDIAPATLATAAAAARAADPATRATALPAVALAAATLGDRTGAAGLLLEALRAAIAAPAGRERVAALGQIAQGQAQLGDGEAARLTAGALDQEAARLTDPAGRLVARVHRARVDVALGQGEAARTALRQAAADINRVLADPAITPSAQVALVATYAVAQREAGDRASARQALSAIQGLMARVTQPFERFVALVTQAEAILQVER